MTPITYERATELLGVANITLKHAVGRGIFTRLPREGLYQPLIEEQVMLFRGKKRLSRGALNAQERETWEHYNKLAQAPNADKISDMDVQTIADKVSAQVLESLGLAFLTKSEDLKKKAFPVR